MHNDYEEKMSTWIMHRKGENNDDDDELIMRMWCQNTATVANGKD